MSGLANVEASEASHQIIADLLEARTGQQLTESRRWRVNSALSGVYRKHGISNVDQLVCLLGQKSDNVATGELAREVVEALLNNETYFFRDKPTFDQLPDRILPELARQRADTRRLSIWSAGCSTGQEVYSLAMLFADQSERWNGWTIDILGTDVSQRAINTARQGLYTQFEVQRGLGVAQMLRHFEETRKGWRMLDATRAPTRFQVHSVLSEPPGRQAFDLILCRNVLLYFDQPTRQNVFARLHGALARDGHLMLGAGETVVGQTRAFTPVPELVSMYRPVKDHSLVRLAATA
jgi:chemotaxis protein methyltransferase CheR